MAANNSRLRDGKELGTLVVDHDASMPGVVDAYVGDTVTPSYFRSYATSVANPADVVTTVRLAAADAALQAQITILQGQVAVLQSQTTSLQTQITALEAANLYTPYFPAINNQMNMTVTSVTDVRFKHHGPAAAGSIVEIIASFNFLFTGAATGQFEMSLPIDTSTPDSRAAGQVQFGPDLTNGVAVLIAPGTAQIMVGNPGLAIVGVANLIMSYIRA